MPALLVLALLAAACDATSVRPPPCRGDACAAPRCGDGALDPGEACDQGDGNSATRPDACRPDCTLPSCGDGVVDSGEACDTGEERSDVEPSACRISCIRSRCGDGVVDRNEDCDDGEANSNTRADACRLNCSPARCGDGVLDGGEACDDRSENSATTPDACRPTCELPACGDGVVDSGEGCDDGPANSDELPDACRTRCEPPACGDGVLDVTETCDDGNEDAGDGCGASCEVERDLCAGAISIGPVRDGVLVHQGSTLGERNDDSPSCTPGADNEDVLLALPVTFRSHVELEVSSNDPRLSPVLDVRDGCRGSPRVLGCSLRVAPWPSRVVLPDVPAGTIYVAVDEPGRRRGAPFTLMVRQERLRLAGEACDVASAERCEGGQACVSGRCVPERCGDGQVSGDEACDDGNVDGDDGCAGCRFATTPVRLAVLREVVIEGTTARAQPGESCLSGRSGARVFEIRAPSSARWTARLESAFPGAAIQVGTNCLAATEEGVSFEGAATLKVAVGTTAHRPSAEGPFTLTLSPAPLLARGEPCPATDPFPPCDPGTVCSAVSGTCEPPRCGDGVRSGAEACDDGNAISADGCEPDCRSSPCDTPVVVPLDAGGGFALAGALGPRDTERFLSFTAPFAGRWDVEAEGRRLLLSAGRSCLDRSSLAFSSGSLEGLEQISFEIEEGEQVLVSVTSRDLEGGGFAVQGNARPLVSPGAPCDPGRDACEAPTVCGPGGTCAGSTCGDGERSGSETCDDGNVFAGDGCSPACTREGSSCADAIDVAAVDRDPAVDGLEILDDAGGMKDSAWSACSTHLGTEGGQDLIYRLTAGDRPELWSFELESTPGEFPSLEVLRTCGEPSSVLACAWAADVRPAWSRLGPARAEIAAGESVYLHVDTARRVSSRFEFRVRGSRWPSAITGEACGDDTPCLFASCVRGRCEAAVCGDGTTDSGERCDDGNQRSGDGCTPDCRVEGDTCETALDFFGVARRLDDPVRWSVPLRAIRYADDYAMATGRARAPEAVFRLTAPVDGLYEGFGDTIFSPTCPPGPVRFPGPVNGLQLRRGETVYVVHELPWVDGDGSSSEPVLDDELLVIWGG